MNMNENKKKVLITGATGFMGSYLVPKLVSENCEVRILVRDRNRALNLFGNTCEIVCGDITDSDSLKGCCDDIDVVYHMAALMGHDSPSEEAFNRFRKVNVDGVNNIISEAIKSGVKRFIHISSTAAMGLQDAEIVDETLECKPYTPYQMTKYEGELCVLDAVKNKQLPGLIVRPSMVYGPGFKGDFLTLAKVCKTGFFPKIGLGENLSPALYITDLVEGLWELASKGKVGEVYLLSSKESYSLKDTALIISKALKKRIIFVYVPRFCAVMGASMLEKLCSLVGKKPMVTKRNIQSISKNRTVDISKLINDVGFIPKVPLQEGLPKTICYFQEQKYI